MSFTRPSFASITVHEEVDDLVDVFRLLSTMKFFFLRLDRFIQILKTSSPKSAWNSCFRISALTVSEDLFPLSIQESPNLFAFRVLSLNFLTLARDLCHGKQRVSPFYHGSLTMTTTDDRQDDRPCSE